METRSTFYNFSINSLNGFLTENSFDCLISLLSSTSTSKSVSVSTSPTLISIRVLVTLHKYLVPSNCRLHQSQKDGGHERSSLGEYDCQRLFLPRMSADFIWKDVLQEMADLDAAESGYMNRGVQASSERTREPTMKRRNPLPFTHCPSRQRV